MAIAYSNDFKLMMIITLMAFPLILLIRTKPVGPVIVTEPTH